jgi:hypothetical protein
MIQQTQYLFDREWALTIGQQGQQGKVYTSLRTAFDIDKTSQYSSNKAKIDVYNLSAYSRQQFQKGWVIGLRVGYRGITDTIYLGDIARSYSKRSGGGPEIITTFECGDSERQLVYAHFDRSYPPGTALTQVVSDVSNVLKGLGVGIAMPVYTTVATSKTFSTGFSFSGTVKNCLEKLLPGVGMEWSIQNNSLQLLPVKHHLGNQAILINKNTGMVGVPSQEVGFVQFQALLNPKIIVGATVAIESQTVNGVFKVRRAHFTGDSHSSDKWTVDCEAVRINATQNVITNSARTFQVIA